MTGMDQAKPGQGAPGRAGRPAMGVLRGAVATMAACLLAACGGDTAQEADEPPKAVTFEVAKLHEGPHVRRLPGLVRAFDRSAQTFEVNGRIESIAVDLGERFKKGDVLARLDARTFEITVHERQAQLKEARARLTEARRDFERKKDLVDTVAVSEAQFDIAAAQFESARQMVALADARLALARENLADTRLTAPFDGVVAARLMEPGEQAGPGVIVLRVESETAAEVRTLVPETLIVRTFEGGRHRISFPSRPGVDAFAAVTEMGSRAETGNAFPVTLRLESPDPAIRPGMSAEVHLNLDRGIHRQLIRVPVSAITPNGDGHVAFVLTGQGNRLERRQVSVSALEGAHAYLADGIEPGERVVDTGTAFLRDGQTVRVLGDRARRFNP
ncbi:efflux RND transporter periplasmic adaptor subunit [Yunchengibacter salinarum]|uniref:efflux RND transporter periplasmic adaptor subunit n=1 Tax=Yunchengibacter salinarum TaxID=3133399 RepID=UPI0035B597F3